MNVLAKNWWAVLVRGLLGIAFGVIAWTWPKMTLFVLVLIYGAYAFTDGMFAIASAVRAAQRQERWWPIALEGAFGVAVGLLVFFVPPAAAVALLVLVATWALVTGVLEIVAAIRLRKHIKGEWLEGLSGVLSIAFGVLLLMRPAAGLLALAWLIAAYAFVFGVMMIALAFRLRRIGAEVHAPITGPTVPQPV
jgi:uncharacterized membrane protein HdeD (DUF308 family)